MKWKNEAENRSRWDENNAAKNRFRLDAKMGLKIGLDKNRARWNEKNAAEIWMDELQKCSWNMVDELQKCSRKFGILTWTRWSCEMLQSLKLCRSLPSKCIDPCRVHQSPKFQMWFLTWPDNPHGILQCPDVWIHIKCTYVRNFGCNFWHGPIDPCGMLQYPDVRIHIKCTNVQILRWNFWHGPDNPLVIIQLKKCADLCLTCNMWVPWKCSQKNVWICV